MGDLASLNAVWTRTIYEEDGSVLKEQTNKASIKVYTGLTAADDADDVYTISIA